MLLDIGSAEPEDRLYCPLRLTRSGRDNHQAELRDHPARLPSAQSVTIVTMQDPDAVTEVFRRRGLKVTPQRQSIFRILHGSAGHLTAESVYRRAREEMPTISLKTVYDTLHSLAALGEIQSLDLGTGSTLFDATTRPHHHLVCTSCRRTEDVDFELGSLDPAERHGFVILTTDVVARGLCPDCAQLAGQSG
jgi:Fe2+ or Zn2+ uptake regulation protein